MTSRRSGRLLAVLAVLSLLAPAAASPAPRRDTTQPYRSLDVLAEVLAHIQNGYVDEMKEKELVQAAWFEPEEVLRLQIPRGGTISRRLIDWFLSEHGNPGGGRG